MDPIHMEALTSHLQFIQDQLASRLTRVLAGLEQEQVLKKNMVEDINVS